jgi:putative thioredoxin
MENIVNVDMNNAQTYLIDESFKRPVVIDFWADWCAPCKALMPILESFVNESNGAFLLAKVNADTENMIAAQFGVRSLPTVVVMKDGQPVDGFTGAKSPSEVKAFLGKYLPEPWEAPLHQAQLHMATQQYSEALPFLKTAYELSKNRAHIALDMVQVYLEIKRLDEAEALLATIKMADQDVRFEQLKASLSLKREAAKTPELQALEEALRNSPDDLSIKFQLAMQLTQESEHRAALEHLYAIVKQDRTFGEGEALQAYKAVIADLGKGDSLAIEFQRRLFTLLY